MSQVQHKGVCIGALNSVRLQSSGQDGCFIDLHGLRELDPCVSAGVFDKMGIVVEHRDCGPSSQQSDRYEVPDWIRLRPIGGKAVLPVEWEEQKNAWIPLNKKRSYAY